MAGTISPQTHVARGATFIFAQGFINSALGVLYVWFLLHTKEITGQVLFTEYDMGMFAILSFVMSLASTLGVLALRPASTRYIAHYLADGKEQDARSVIKAVLQISMLTSSIIGIILLTLAGLLASAVGGSFLLFVLLPLPSVLTIFFSQAQGFLQGLQKMRELATVVTGYAIVHYSLGIVFVYIGLGLLGIIASWIIGLAISLGSSLFLVLKDNGGSIGAHEIRPLLAFSGPIYVSTILTLVVGWVDQIFILPFKNVEALGAYNLAVRASIVPNLVSVALVTSLFPKLSEIHARLGTESLRDAFKTATRYAALLGFPVSLLVATLAYPIFILFATVRFVDAVIPLAVMCIASLPTILGLAISPILYTLKQTKLVSATIMVSIIVEATLSYIFLAYLNADLEAVAVTRLVATVCQFMLGSYLLNRIIRIAYDKEAIWKSTLASLLMVLSLLGLEALRSVIEPTSFQFLVLRLRLLPIYAIVGIIVYVFSLLLLKAIVRRDLELVSDYLPSRLQWIVKVFRRFVKTS